MLCPFCLNSASKVTDKRASKDSMRRRRECLKCGKRFTTYEKIVESDFFVVKKSGAREKFQREKLEKGIERAFEKRPVSKEKIDLMINEIEDHLEIPYFVEIEDSFKYVEVKNDKDQVYFEKLLDSYHKFIEATVKLDTLGKERLFSSEWIMISMLSLIVAFSILFLDISHIFYKIILLVFPAILSLVLSIIYDLDTLLWSKEIVSLEPNERLFDAINVKRFYLKKKRKFISPHIKSYKTEDDLKGELKKVYLDIVENRKSPEKRIKR